MLVLQIANDSIGVSIEATGFTFFGLSLFEIEQYIIYLIILIQLGRFIIISKNIYLLNNVFDFPLLVKYGYIDKPLLQNNSATIEDIVFNDSEGIDLTDEIIDDTTVKITIVKAKGTHSIAKRMEKSINTYLLNNYGANVNFGIIKDMIDREIDVNDEEISQSIPTPLYLGLAATMLGIIFGLGSMPEIDGDNFTKAINFLINGVKWAMIASVIGLVLTTLLSSVIYKIAKRNILHRKNEQLSYLQAELLPELIKAEDTGVSGLKASLDHFAREATTIVDNVKIASINTGENIKNQQLVLDKVEKLKINRVSKVTLELFDKLDNNMKAFNKFSKNISIIEDISTNLKEFATRTGSIDRVATQIKSSLDESKKLSRFLSEHFEKIESSGNQALRAVDYSDSHFREAIEKLTEEIDERISKINSNTNNHESQLQEIYENIGIKLNSITSKHLHEFRLAYDDAVPKFSKLNNLDFLEPIKESIDQNLNFSKIGSESLERKVGDIKNYLEKETDIIENIKNLENVINELSISITGKDSKTVNSNSKWNKIFQRIEMSLKLAGWLVIISIGVYTILNHFQLI